MKHNEPSPINTQPNLNTIHSNIQQQVNLSYSYFIISTTPFIARMSSCANCDCSDQTQCVKKAETVETSFTETMVMNESGGQCKCASGCGCGSSCSCSGCGCCK